MPTCHAGPRSFTGALAGGLAASSVILLANQVAEPLGVTELDLPHVLGLSFLDPGQYGIELAGSAWYFLTGGLVVPTLYWLGFRSLGTAGARRGLALGLVHYFASSLLLSVSEPACPKRRHGRGAADGASPVRVWRTGTSGEPAGSPRIRHRGRPDRRSAWREGVGGASLR